MQKKYVLSLLMVAPAAVPVMGAITVVDPTTDGWKLSDVTGELNVSDSGEVSAPLGGVVKQTLSELPKGKYILTIENADNIVVSVNGKTMELKEGKVEFEAEGTVELEITSFDKVNKAFKFGKVSLELDFDFDAAKAALEAQLNEVVLVELKDPEVAEELATTLADLKKDKDAIVNNINGLSNDTSTLEDYEKFGFDNDNAEYTANEIAKAIEVLAGKAETYNSDADNSNTAYDVATYNAEKEEALNKQIANMEGFVAELEKLMGTEGYVYDENHATVEEIKQRVADHKANVEKVFDALTEKISDEDFEALDVHNLQPTDPYEDYLQCKKDIAADKADADAKQAWDEAVAELDAELLNAKEAIAALKPAVDYAGAFDADKVAWTADLEQIVKDAKDALAIKETAGAAKLLDADLETIANANDALAKVVSDANDKVVAANDAYSDALDVINKLIASKNEAVEAVGDTLPTDYKTDFDARVEGINAEIVKLKLAIDKAYAEQELSEETYSDDATSIQAQINSLATVADKYAELQGLTDKLKEATKDFDDFLNKRFNNNINVITDAISSLAEQVADATTADKVSAIDTQEVKDALKYLSENAQKLGEAYQAVDGALEGFKADLAKVDALEKSQTVISGNEYTWAKFKASETYTNLTKKLTEFNEAFTTAKNAEDDNVCYNGIIDLKADLDAAGFAGDCAAAIEEYCTGVVEGNKAVADNLFAELEKKLEAEFAGKDGMEAAKAKAETDLSDIATEIAGLGTSGDVAKDSEEITGKIQTVIDDLKKAVEDSDALIKSQQLYDDLSALLTRDDSVQAAINAAKAKNEEVSTDFALAHYKAEIEKLQTEFNTLTADIEEAHKEGTITDEKGEEFKTSLNKIKDDAESLTKAIQANADALTKALAQGLATVKHINDVIASVNGYEDGGVANFTTQKATAIEALEALIDAAEGIDTEAVTKYGKGEAAPEAQFIEQYEGLVAQADEILGNFDKAFGDGAVEHNNKLKNGVWAPLYKELTDAYTVDVNAFNEYDNLHNEGYKAVIAPLLEEYTNEGIFQYYDQIEQLNKDVLAWFDAKNSTADADGNKKSPEAISETDAELQGFKDKAAEIKAGMAEVSQALKDAVDSAAENFYKEHHTAAQKNVEEAEAQLNAAGITDVAICDKAAGEAGRNLVAAEAAYESAKNIGVDMDNIADYLDKAVVTDKALLDAAKEQWTQDVANAKADADALAEELAGYTEATEVAKNAAADAIADAREMIDFWDAEAKRVLTGLDAYPGLYENLVSVLDDARAAVEKAADSHDKVVANKALLDDYNAQLADLDAALKAYIEYVADLAGDNEASVDGATEAVDNAKAAVETNKEDLAANEQAVTNAISAAENALDAAYQAAADRELKVIDAQLSRVKIAFNNAVAGGDQFDDEDTVKKNAEILDLEAARKALAYDAEDKDGFKTEATRIESALNNLEAELNAAALDAALAEVDAEYDRVAGVIAEYEAALEGYEAETIEAFGDAPYAGFKKQLDDLKAKWSEGNGVLTMKGNYIKQLGDIEEAADALAAEIADKNASVVAEKEKIAVSQARYEVLKAELVDMNAGYASFKERVEGFGFTEYYQELFDMIDATLTAWSNQLEEANAKNALTEDTAYWSKSDFEMQLGELEAMATKPYLNDRIAAANKAILDARASLVTEAGKRIVPEVAAELTATLDALTASLSTVVTSADEWVLTYDDETGSNNISDLDGYIAEVDRIVAEATDAKATAVDSVFMAGDIDDNGEVDVLDVQTVLNWVGKNVAYNDLYAESPRMAVAADIDQNGKLNIGDATAVVNISLGEEASMVRFAMGRKATASDGNRIFAELVSEENGIRRYAVNLLNSETFVAGQFDIVLPIGMEFVGASLGERALGHELLTFDNGDSTRILLASMENAAINGENGVVVYVDVTGNGSLNIEGALFANRQARTFEVAPAETSLIDAIRSGLHNMKESIYNVAGQTLNRVQRGINIIRKADGTTTKELRK